MKTMGAWVCAGAMFLSGSAAAQDLTSVAGLEERLAHEASVVDQLLDASECPRACLALEAMRQAADRLCSLDPAAPGARARVETEAKARTVAAACPDCHEAKAILDGGPAGKDSVACATASGPPATDKGGCAGCAVAVAHGGFEGPCWLGGLALAMGRRRGRSRRARDT